MDEGSSALQPGLKRLPPEDELESSDQMKRAKTDDISVIGHQSAATEGVVMVTTGDPTQPKKVKNMSRRRDAAGYAKSRKGKEKDGKNTGRRGGTRQDTSAAEGQGRSQTEDHSSKAPRLPKRQCALLIGFCGTGCNGMQIQPDVRTIEGVLFEAMVKAGAVSQDNANDPTKVNLGRAARTDAGVHAAGNVVSLKMITTVPGVPDIVVRINEELPPEIRVWGYVRVQNSFSARLACDSRKYTYFFPTYLLIPPKPGGKLHQVLDQQTASDSPALAAGTFSDVSHSFWSRQGITLSSKDDDLRRKRQWRVGPDLIVLLREMAKKFEGTHNFHNFTVGRDFGDRSSQRHMKKIEISDPAVYGNTEWLSVMLHGQSFMLHQRKMMSALVLSCRTGTPSQIIDGMYGPQVVNIPKMPSLGLLLEHPIFGSYNDKVTKINENLKPTDPEYRPPIDFDIYHDIMEHFKKEHIYDIMRAIEDRDGVFDAWMQSIDSYSGNDLLYLNSKGTIPAAAILKKGERRTKPFKDRKRFDATGFDGINKTDTFEEEENDTIVDKARLVDMEG